MASLTPAKGRWIDIGSGMKVYDSEVTQDIIAGTPVPVGAAATQSNSFDTPNRPDRGRIGLNTPPPSQQKERSELAPNIPKTSYHKHDYKLKVPDSQGRKLPRILFRWYNINSQGLNSRTQLRAGLYKRSSSTILSPASGKKLEDTFLSHLTPEKKLSPFISTFENFLPALNRALRSQEEAFIVIIDLQRVEKSLRRRFPEAKEVIWPIKALIKKYDFKLRNHYKGFEWLIYGIVEESDIIQTFRVSDLQAFTRTGKIRHMHDVLQYISERQHAFGLLANLPIKLPKTNYRTGQMVGKVLNFLEIPDAYKGIVARKVKTMMKFERYLSPGRDQSYRSGVYNPNHSDSDSNSDGLDDFILDSDDDIDSDGTFWDESEPDIRRNTATRKSRRATAPESETEEDSDTPIPKPPTRTKRTKVQVQHISKPSTDKNDHATEQALLDAQLHATTKQWMTSTPTTSTRRMLQISHIDVPRLTAEQRATFKPIKQTPTSPQIIDLTSDNDDDDDDDDDITSTHPWPTNEDLTVIATATRARRSMNLAIRSSSLRSTIGLGGGLARLEAHAAAAEDFEVMEVLQFD